MTVAPALAVDTHAHVFHPGLPMVPGRRYTPDDTASLAAYLALLDAQALTHGVLVQPSFLGTDNRFLLEALAQAPARLRGVAVIDASTPATALPALHAAGIVGIRLNLIGLPAPDFTAGHWPELLQAVRQLDWHVEVHAPSLALAAILAPLLDHGCRVVVDHFGRPAPAQGLADPGLRHLLALADTGQVWVKLSAPYRLWPSAPAALPCAQALLSAFGEQRLVWGSDWPHTEHRQQADHASSRAWLDLWIPDPEQRAVILGETARTLFQFPGDNTP